MCQAKRGAPIRRPSLCNLARGQEQYQVQHLAKKGGKQVALEKSPA